MPLPDSPTCCDKALRLDLLLCRLRLVKTRSLARTLVENGSLRVNGERAVRAARPIAAGDVLTLVRGGEVALVEIVALPERRGPPAEARACYRTLDRAGQSAIAPAQEPASDRGPPKDTPVP